MAFKFEELRVWQRALELSESICLLKNGFPEIEKFGLASQIQRAADSIALNIAEGSTGQSNAEFRRFLGYSIRSSIEVVACLHLGRRRGLIKDESFSELYEELEMLVKMLQKLRNSLG